MISLEILKLVLYYKFESGEAAAILTLLIVEYFILEESIVCLQDWFSRCMMVAGVMKQLSYNALLKAHSITTFPYTTSSSIAHQK